MRLSYRILNVFSVAGDRLSGNPLCVFEDGSALDTPAMQALARQLNLSETTFILPSDQATARVRIFTPTFEMPFAGHPTLGTAHVVNALKQAGDKVTLEMAAGIIPVTASGERWTLRARESRADGSPARADVARMIGLPVDAIGGELGAEPMWIDAGSRQLVIPIADPRHVDAIAVDAALAKAFPGFAEEAKIYTVARTAPGEILARFFFSQHGSIVEDPATGSACANLGGYFLATGRPLPVRETIHQGERVARPSRLELEVTSDRAIFVTGAVTELGGGAFDI